MPAIDETATGNAPTDDAVGHAAYAALATGSSQWIERVSGSVGTVERLGSYSENGCVRARLTIHDFAGLRIEERPVCPPATEA